MTYTLGFHPDAGSLDGHFHRIQVKLDRPGLVARYREGYLAEPDARLDDDARVRRIAEALTSPLESAGIRARLQVNRDHGLNVTVVMDAADLAFARANGRRAAALDIVFRQRAADGRALDTASWVLHPSLGEAEYREALSIGLGLSKTLTLADDAALLQVVIFDRAAARVGSLAAPL